MELALLRASVLVKVEPPVATAHQGKSSFFYVKLARFVSHSKCIYTIKHVNFLSLLSGSVYAVSFLFLQPGLPSIRIALTSEIQVFLVHTQDLDRFPIPLASALQVK
jgi:hypothetical protein